jgi:large subunit ribosomal protein L10
MKVGAVTRQLMVEEYKRRIQSSQYILLANCKGINAMAMNDIRAKLKNLSSKMMVVRNNLLRRAFQEMELQQLLEYIQGELGIIYGTGDPIQVAKEIKRLTKEYEGLKLQAGYLEGKVFDQKGMLKIAELPSRDMLYAQIVGLIKAPISNLVYVLKANINSLVNALRQIKEKKESQ